MKIKVLLAIPGKEIQLVKIPESSKFIKAFIGENLARIRLNKDAVLIFDAKAPSDEFNRILGGNILVGTFLIIGIKNHHRVSLNKKQIRKYSNMFSLKKHQKKINLYREEYLEEYYFNQRKMKQKNAERNKKEIFKLAA